MKNKLQKWGDSAVFVMTRQMLRDYDLIIGRTYDLEVSPIIPFNPRVSFEDRESVNWKKLKEESQKVSSKARPTTTPSETFNEENEQVKKT